MVHYRMLLSPLAPVRPTVARRRVRRVLPPVTLRLSRSPCCCWLFIGCVLVGTDGKLPLCFNFASCVACTQTGLGTTQLGSAVPVSLCCVSSGYQYETREYPLDAVIVMIV